MVIIDWLVIGGGLALIGFIAYYFFGPKNESEVAVLVDEAQKATVVVDAAYIPGEIKVKVNVPTEITFDRRDRGDCTEWVIFERVPTKEDKEIKQRLPEGEKTVVRFTPIETGEFDFVCGMGMVHGKLKVIN